MQWHGVVGDLGTKAALFKTLSAEGPGAVDLGIRLLPGCAIAQPGDGLEVRPPTFALAARLKHRIDIGIQGSGCALRQNANYRVRLALHQDRLSEDAPI